MRRARGRSLARGRRQLGPQKVSEETLKGAGVKIPKDAKDVELNLDGREVRLTNLQKPFWPEEGISKGDLPSLLWTINLGCIDLNPWYTRCDDFNRPDYLHFDLWKPLTEAEGRFRLQAI